MNVSLLPDASGQPATSAQALATQTFQAVSDFASVVSLTFPGSVDLEAGIPYWVAFASDPASDAWIAFSTSVGGVSYASSTDYGVSWVSDYGTAPPAFEIKGIVVPEPGSFSILIVMGAFVHLMVRHQNRTEPRSLETTPVAVTIDPD